jgi:superfamily I DNA/RNA helicase
MTQNGVWTLAAYLGAERIGRAEARLTRADRPVVFRVFETYRELRQVDFMYDWDDIAWAVLDAVDGDDTPRMYKHIVADEMQDFSVPMLASLARYVPADGSLTVFGDAAQQIYGRRVSWKSAGLKVRQPWRFEQNYRNSAAIAKLAIAISRMPYYKDVEDLVEPAPATAAGPNPTLLRCTNPDVEVEQVIAVARARAQTGTVGILTRDRGADNKRIARRLPRTYRELRGSMPVWPGGNGIYLGTIHSGKGLEFDTVILPFLGDHQLPIPGDIENYGEEEASSRDGRLLFVGVTRAKQELVLTHTGAPTRLLPADPSLYIRVAR